MKLGQLEVDLDEFTHFLVKAKKNGYAGGTGKITEIDGSKTFTFQEGNFHYTDNYAGSYQAPGQEIVRWQRGDGQRIWQMAYSGGMLEKFWGNNLLSGQTFEFLKEALKLVDSRHPFRGPPIYERKTFRYTVDIKGDIERFSGQERILDSRLRNIVFSQDFIGGLVIPK